MVIFFCLLAVVVQSDSKKGASCFEGKSVLEVDTFLVSPDPPLKNSNLHLDLEGGLSQVEDITQLTWQVHRNGDFYEQEEVQLTDPCPGGQCTIKHDFFIKGTTLSGNYVMKVLLMNSKNTEVSCWQFEYSL